MVYNNCALYMLLYKQCRGFYCCSKRVHSKREVCVLGTPSSLCVWHIYTSGNIVIVHTLSIDLRIMYVYSLAQFGSVFRILMYVGVGRV